MRVTKIWHTDLLFVFLGLYGRLLLVTYHWAEIIWQRQMDLFGVYTRIEKSEFYIVEYRMTVTADLIHSKYEYVKKNIKVIFSDSIFFKLRDYL